MISTVGKAASVGAAFMLLWAMRSTTPSYDQLTGPIPFAAAPQTATDGDNLRVEAGEPLLAKTIRFKALSQTRERTTDGVWLVVPLRVQALSDSTRVLGALWQASDGRRYAASQRVEDANAGLPGKDVQPGLERRNVLVFELPMDAAHDGVLLLSEQAYPRLTAQLHIPYRDGPVKVPMELLDLDSIHVAR